MQDILTIIRKEFWQLEISKKRIFIVIIFILLPVVGISYNVFITDERALLPINSIAIFLSILIAISLSSQLSLNTILDEKKTKTLESLLATNISKFAIIIGKVMPPVIISTAISILSLLLLKIYSLIILNQNNISINYSISLFYIIFILSYFSSCITVLMTILITDEKIIPVISNVPLYLIIFVLIKYGGQISLNLTYIVITLFICIIVTWIATITINRVTLITKI
ncbi:hypothetical protein [Clostridium grantii]|uniref:ABC-2 type transport system permease protein n=1 Tax=Clostridium grantii DSM 8605 TaxID=1121316 RepID=A0A1M5WT44_9CLOT|nr:hypothetical protein [Clostridium grantii]SHH90699.1 hypothetical protein SAMN02745207_03100 [Clostridium grantii DSM 8605]